MTDTRLYYTEPYRTSFDGTVVSVEPVDGRLHVVLDQTAFYPTSGGQPFDIGTLGGAAVTEVIDREDGTIAHVVSGTVKPGEVVAGAIDWARRFDHMQQHTGQHVLSAAFDRLFGVRTESFHLGAAASSIDLAREVSATELRQAEDEANRIVWEDRMVHIRFASADEAAAMPLRKESLRTGPLRLIDVRGLRPVGVRRHARGPDGRHRHHRDRRGRKVSRRLARRVPVRRPRARAIPPVARCDGRDTASPLGRARGNGGGDRADAGGCEGAAEDRARHAREAGNAGSAGVDCEGHACR